MPKTTKNYRFDAHTLDTLEGLKVRLNLSNNSEVLRRAITLLELATKNQAQVLLKEGDSVKEVMFL